VPEYGRERCEELGTGRPALDELLHIAQTQVEREREAASQANGWLVCDTSPLTTRIYADHDHAATEPTPVPPALDELAQRHYDRVLLCAPDFGFVQDGSRRGEVFRALQHERTVAWLAALGSAPLTVHGSLAARVDQALRAL
jgi:HTH-type transcriptional regulator, transcriptional repressor of NAD biosynthesis genes